MSDKEILENAAWIRDVASKAHMHINVKSGTVKTNDVHGYAKKVFPQGYEVEGNDHLSEKKDPAL
ncbi:hypothetical protein ASF12_13915 [Paenibacillus sp. Leaf72]|nr:hypothetical protein ASF12_13915 [Paenibacillus sp. Leaf72]